MKPLAETSARKSLNPDPVRGFRNARQGASPAAAEMGRRQTLATAASAPAMGAASPSPPGRTLLWRTGGHARTDAASRAAQRHQSSRDQLLSWLKSGLTISMPMANDMPPVLRSIGSVSTSFSPKDKGKRRKPRRFSTISTAPVTTDCAASTARAVSTYHSAGTPGSFTPSIFTPYRKLFAGLGFHPDRFRSHSHLSPTTSSTPIPPTTWSSVNTPGRIQLGGTGSKRAMAGPPFRPRRALQSGHRANHRVV